jgi:SNF2 family DNA or RNA helicase
MQINPFIVNCERIGRRQAYYLRFLINDQIITRIKELPEDTRKWNAGMMLWEVSTSSLLILIKRYKGSTKIRFDFGNEESRKIFISQISKIEKEEEEKRKFIADLNINKENWVKYKLELEETYVQYSEKCHALLNEGIKLYKHQIVAALFMNATRNTLISHEMGLGKTASSILYVEMNKFEKVVVITPNSLKFNFFQEINKFTMKSTAHIVNWKKNNCSIENSKYIIINYDFFNTGNKEKFQKKWNNLNISEIDAVICDEASKLKNSKSNTYKNFKKTFSKNIFKNEKVSKIFLSGTPMPSHSFEIYNILHEISPIDFGNKKYFYSYFCGMEYNFNTGWGYTTNNAEAKLEELYYKIAPYTHRKRKFEAIDLPDKIYQKIILEMEDDENKIYYEIENNVANEFATQPNNNPLTILIRLRQFTAHLKIKCVLDLIDNISDTGEKIVIVDMFKESLYKLKEKLGDKACLHTGDQSVEERAEMVKEFQDPNSNIKIFLGSIQTCSYGLTLTAASKLFIMSLPFTVSEYQQVSDRLHRIGQKNIVNIYPLVFKDTIDEYVFSIIENKTKTIVKVMDNEDYQSEVSESVLGEVINKIKEKYRK